jgi:tetratricopeptide (TPR) repeat protein
MQSASESKFIFLVILSTGFLFLSLSVDAQVNLKGRIIDTMICASHTSQSYSLYLPEKYSEGREWPVILVFDPSARGRTALEVFREGAGRYGYIIACPLNSKNGPLNINFDAAGSVLNDLAYRFKLDKRRVYVAGFSGGSRVALAIAVTNNIIAGVIGCGAGLPNEKSLWPLNNSSFLYYGIAGTRDMNLLEMLDLMEYMKTTRVMAYLRTFDGGHQWPSPEIMQEAIEWLTIRAMSRALIATDSAVISSSANKTKMLVKNLTASGNLTDAARYMKYVIRDFPGTGFAKETTLRLASLEQSKSYKDALHEFQNISTLENSKKEKYIRQIENISNLPYVPDSVLSWWKSEIGTLNPMRDNTGSLKSPMASRLLNFISILCSEQGTALFRQKQFDLSSFYFEVCTLSDSENMNNFYNLARSLSSSNRKKEAIDALNKAINHGFNSKKLIEVEPAFNNIRNDEKFKLVYARMK